MILSLPLGHGGERRCGQREREGEVTWKLVPFNAKQWLSYISLIWLQDQSTPKHDARWGLELFTKI